MQFAAARGHAGDDGRGGAHGRDRREADRRRDQRTLRPSVSTDAEIIRRELRTPRAAAIAGVVFSLLLGVSLVLIRISVPADPSDARRWLADSGRRHVVQVAVSLVPFAGIAFHWFIGVVRDRLGDREDRFFATVFLGSGLLFVAMLFAAAAVVGGILATFALDQDAFVNSITFHFARSVAYNIINIYAAKVAGAFLISTST